LPQPLADFRAARTSFSDAGRNYTPRGRKCPAQIVGLRVVAFFEPGPATSICLAGQQEFLESLFTPECIRALKDL
jgi:hypothetical protein